MSIPTASRDETGSGKWQAGLAGVVIAPQTWGMLGGLLAWQQSIAGDDDRLDVSSLQRTLRHDGEGVPKFKVFFGLNMFPL